MERGGLEPAGGVEGKEEAWGGGGESWREDDWRWEAGWIPGVGEEAAVKVTRKGMTRGSLLTSRPLTTPTVMLFYLFYYLFIYLQGVYSGELFPRHVDSIHQWQVRILGWHWCWHWFGSVLACADTGAGSVDDTGAGSVYVTWWHWCWGLATVLTPLQSSWNNLNLLGYRINCELLLDHWSLIGWLWKIETYKPHTILYSSGYSKLRLGK